MRATKIERPTRLVLLALALLFAAPLHAQSKRCRQCKSSGYIECEAHRRLELDAEHGVLFCSVLDGCEECGGTGHQACAECDDGSRAAGLAAKRAAWSARRDALAELDRVMGRPLRKAESENFVLVWEMSGMKVGKVRRDEHAMLHLTLERLEALRADYVELFAVDPRDLRKKPRVFVWSLPADHRKGSTAFCDLFAPAGSKLMGIDPNYSVCGNRQFFRGDEQLHRNLVHCVTHLLFSHQRPSEWIGNLGGGWIDEGLAHFFEQRGFGVCDNYCFEEQNARFDFKGGKFRPGLRALVEAGEAPSVAALLGKNSDQLEPAEHALALALVEHLVELDPVALAAVGRGLRARGSARELLAEHFDVSPIELQERLFAWVLETYPRR